MKNVLQILDLKIESIKKITKISNDGFGGKAKIDSVVMTIKFQDGDGDLGITTSEKNSDPKYKDYLPACLDSTDAADSCLPKSPYFGATTLSMAFNGDGLV